MLLSVLFALWHFTKRHFEGATTLSIAAFTMMTLRKTMHCHYAECHISIIVMLNVIMLKVIVQSVMVPILQCHCVECHGATEMTARMPHEIMPNDV
jgi:hypothetical protein